jgi:SulP family sulfate permease
MAATFLLTVFIDLTAAVEVGLVLAIILFIKQMHGVHSVTRVSPDKQFNKVSPDRAAQGNACPQVSIFTLEGPLFFATTQALEESVSKELSSGPKTILLRMSKVPYLDVSGEAVIAAIVKQVHQKHGTLLISGIREQPRNLMVKTGLLEEIGAKQFFEHTGEAIDYSLTRLDLNKCRGCKHFAFQECAALSDSPRNKEKTGAKEKEFILA